MLFFFNRQQLQDDGSELSEKALGAVFTVGAWSTQGGRFFTGLARDRFGTSRVACMCLIIVTLGSLGLALSDPNKSIALGASLFSVGIGSGAQLCMLPVAGLFPESTGMISSSLAGAFQISGLVFLALTSGSRSRKVVFLGYSAALALLTICAALFLPRGQSFSLDEETRSQKDGYSGNDGSSVELHSGGNNMVHKNVAESSRNRIEESNSPEDCSIREHEQNLAESSNESSAGQDIEKMGETPRSEEESINLHENSGAQYVDEEAAKQTDKIADLCPTSDEEEVGVKEEEEEEEEAKPCIEENDSEEKPADKLHLGFSDNCRGDVQVSEKTARSQERVSGHGVQDETNMIASGFSESVPLEDRPPTAMEQAKSSEYILLCTWFSIVLIPLQYYIGSIGFQLEAKGDDGFYTDLFSIIYASATVFAPLGGYLGDRCGLGITQGLATFFISISFFILASDAVKLNGQIGGLVAYSLGRMFIFGMYFTNNGKRFGYTNYGTLVGLGLLISAIVSLLQYPLIALAAEGKAATVNIASGVTLLSLFPYFVWLNRKENSANSR